jgi:hypothetical protein
MPAFARLYCNLRARDSEILGLVFDQCRRSAEFGRFICRLSPNLTNLPFKFGPAKDRKEGVHVSSRDVPQLFVGPFLKLVNFVRDQAPACHHGRRARGV